MTELHCLDNLARLQTTSTYADALNHAVNKGANCLKVGIKPALGSVIRVTDRITELRPFSAYIASLGHLPTPPVKNLSMKANRESSMNGRRAVKPNLEEHIRA